MITTTLIFCALCLFWLIKLSIIDYKHMQIENKDITPLLIFGLAFSLIKGNLLPTALFMGLLFILGFFLWNKGALGGADVKIIVCLVPFMFFHGFPEAIGKTLFFLLSFGIVGTIYGLIGRKILKMKEIPFLPIITLNYMLFMWNYL